MASVIANRLKATRTPLIPVGYTPTLAAFPGTLSIDRSVLENTLRDVALSLVKVGIKRIFVLNGHTGNNNAINVVLRELGKYGAKGATIQVWFFARSHDQELFNNYNSHGHASEAGTSVMLYLRPDLVDTDIILQHIPTPNPYPEITVALDSRQGMPDGMHGDTTEASAEKGRILFERMVDRICDFLSHWVSE
jgi:creatinine amidohydrolase